MKLSYESPINLVGKCKTALFMSLAFWIIMFIVAGDQLL